MVNKTLDVAQPSSGAPTVFYAHWYFTGNESCTTQRSSPVQQQQQQNAPNKSAGLTEVDCIQTVFSKRLT